MCKCDWLPCSPESSIPYSKIDTAGVNSRKMKRHSDAAQWRQSLRLP